MKDRLLGINPAILILICLTVFGFVLRIYGLGQQSLWYDEGYSINAAVTMLDRGLPILPTGWFYSHGLLNTTLMAASMGIFGETEFAARLPSVIFGTLTIPLVFAFARSIGGNRAGLIAAVIVTFLAIEIAWSRQARMYQQLQFFYILSLYLFYLYTQKRSYKLLALTFASTLCAALSHMFGFSLILIYIAYPLLTGFRSLPRYLNRDLLRKKQALIFVLGIALLVIIGQVFFKVFSRTWGFEMNYFAEYTSYLKEVLPVIFYLGVVGIAVMLKRDLKATVLLTLALAIPFYFVCFHVKMLSMRYLYLFMPLIFIFFAHSVTFISDTLARAPAGRDGAEEEPDAGAPPEAQTRTALLQRRLSPSIAAVILGFTLYAGGFSFLPQSEHWLERTAPQPDFKSAYAFINDNRVEGDTVIDSWPTIGFFYLDEAPDYWLAFDIAGTRGVYCTDEEQSRDRYTGIYCLQNAAALEAAVNASASGWLVLDGLATYRLPQSTLNFIEQNLIYYEEGSSARFAGTVKVYGWPDRGADSAGAK